MARVLVVDDYEPSCRAVARLIAGWGHETRCVLSGELALLAMRDTPYDIVLLDLMMPGIDGVEVLGRMRADPGLRGVRVLMYTAVDDERDVRRSVEAGADGYLVKSRTGFDEIRRRIAELAAAVASPPVASSQRHRP